MAYYDKELHLRGPEPPTPPRVTPVVTLEALSALILPWAKTEEPAKYAMTLEVSRVPETFRRYMMRLVELRWERDVAWRTQVPVAVLEDSAIEGTLRRRSDGREFVFRGRRKQPRRWAWAELALDKAEFERLVVLKDTFDLELVDDA